MGKRDAYDCDHCGEAIPMDPVKIGAFGYEYYLCRKGGSDFEGWLKPMAMKLQGMKSEIVKTGPEKT